MDPGQWSLSTPRAQTQSRLGLLLEGPVMPCSTACRIRPAGVSLFRLSRWSCPPHPRAPLSCRRSGSPAGPVSRGSLLHGKALLPLPPPGASLRLGLSPCGALPGPRELGKRNMPLDDGSTLALLPGCACIPRSQGSERLELGNLTPGKRGASALPPLGQASSTFHTRFCQILGWTQSKLEFGSISWLHRCRSQFHQRVPPPRLSAGGAPPGAGDLSSPLRGRICTLDSGRSPTSCAL